MRALNLDGHTITYDRGHKIPADVGMLVLLRRLSYPCTFLQLATEFGISTHQLCELSHATLELIFHRFRAFIEFEIGLPFSSHFAEVFIDSSLRFCRPR